MADSNEVTPSKGKGKIISDTSDMIKANPEVFNPERDVPQVQNSKSGPSSVMASVSGSKIDKDPKDKEVVDMVNGIRELQEKAMERKVWALQKVAQSKTRVEKEYLELQELRMAKEKMRETKYKRDLSEKSLAVKITEEYIQRACCQVGAITDTVRRLELKNAHIKADTVAYKLSAAESEKELKEILKRGKKCEKKLADMEIQSRALKEQCKKELLIAERMELESVQNEKEALEAEIQWKQAVQEQERLLALVAEETRLARTQKANSRAYLSKLRQQVDTECQVAEDEYHRLEEEVSRVCVPRPIDDLLPDNLDFLYNYDEASSSKLKRHLLCMMCLENAVSVFFLPCTHQVLCFPCYESNCAAVGGHCPYCGVGIEKSIKVYGPRS